MSEPSSAIPSATLRGRFLIGLGRFAAALVWLLRIRRSVAMENLARAFPEKPLLERKQLARAVYRSLGTSLGEILLARSITEAQLLAWVTFEGFEKYQQALAQHRGVIIAIGHYGNWELLARAGARRGLNMALIGRRLRGVFNEKLVQARVESGMEQLADRGSSGDVLEHLRSGNTLAIAIDQNMRPRRGIFVDFFGHRACTTPAAAVYSLRVGAPILAVFPVRQPDGRHRVQIFGPIEAPGLRGHEAVRSITEQLTKQTEAMIRAHPEQWFWLHRRWKTVEGGGA